MEKDKRKLNFAGIAGIIITIILIIFIGTQVNKYKFGYFIKGPQMKYEHDGDILKLEDGNILILGSNSHKSPYKNRWSINDLKILETPSELYNVLENKFEEFYLPANIAYWSNGILLKNNKLLLTFAYDPKSPIKYTEYATSKKRTAPFPYDSMAIVDLKTRKVEKMYRKKINLKYEPRQKSTQFTLLGNGKVLIIDFKNKAAEIYNPETNTSKLLNIKIDKEANSVVVAKGKDKALIFGATELTGSERFKLNYFSNDTVEEYNDSTETLKPVGQTILRRSYPTITQLTNNKILITAGQIYSQGIDYTDVREIELYDIENNTSKIIVQMKEQRTNFVLTPNFASSPLNEHYILITGGIFGGYPFYGVRRSSVIIDSKQREILKGPDMRYRWANHKMINLNNGNILLVNYKKSQLFKTWKGVK